MIRFTCPKCRTPIEAENPPPGQPVICPTCRSRLHVQGTAAKQPTPAAASRTEPEYGSYRSRKKKGSMMPLIVGVSVGGGGLLLALIVLIVVFTTRDGEPKPTTVAKNSSTARRPVEPEPEQPQPAQPPRATRAVPSGERPAPSRPRVEEEETKKPINSSPPARSTGERSTPPASTDGTPPPDNLAPSGGSGGSAGQDVYPYVLKSAVWIIVPSAGGISFGTGTLIDKENRVILTNEHVVGNAPEVAVFFPIYRNGKLVMERDSFLEQAVRKRDDVLKAKVLTADRRRDLALIQLDRVPDGYDALPLAKESVATGQAVHSVGNPGVSGALWVYTSGTVRAVYHHRWPSIVGRSLVEREADIVETQSPTNPGDSGGPLVNDRGELVGVTQGGSSTGSLLSVFINVSEARKLIEDTFRRESLTWKPSTRSTLARRGGGGGGDVTSLMKDLESKEARTRARAARALGDMGPEAQIAVPGLLKSLKDDDDLTRRAASDALARIGAPDKRDLPAVTTALKDSHPEVRRHAAIAVGELGGAGRDAVPALAEVAKDSDAGLRQLVLKSLGKIGGSSRDAVIPVLTEALKDSEKDVRIAAAEGLTSLSTGQPADLPIFVALLKNEQDAEIRVQGAKGLAKLGREAKPALGDLIAAGKDSDRLVRKAVIEALVPFGTDARNAVGIFSEALKDSDKGVQKTALTALAKLGPESKGAVPAIRELLKENDTRKEAVMALGKIGPSAKDAIPTLAEFLKEPDKDLKLETMTSLGTIGGPDSAKAVPNLVLLFEDREITFRRRVQETLVKIGKPAVPGLVKGLSDNNPFVRWGCCDALGDIGINANSTPVLRALAQVASSDSILDVREAANRAGAKITGR